MRRTLALVSLAVTSMVALATLVPAALIVRQLANDRTVIDAQRRIGMLVPVVAVSDGPAPIGRALLETTTGTRTRAVVVLPDGREVGGRSLVPPRELAVARTQAMATELDRPGERVVLQPVPGREGIAVVQVSVPEDELPDGVLTAWAVMASVGLLLVLCSVAAADRMGARMVGAARRLGRAAGRLGAGDLSVRVRPEGPPELQETAFAFNTMADRVGRQIATERRMAADLSHRLRTPLTALRLNVDRLGEDERTRPTRLALARLEQEIDTVIRLFRGRDAQDGTARCDAAEVVRERVGYWAALADDQERNWHMSVPDGAAPVPVSRGELAAALDALLGNIFHHTPERTAFGVTLQVGRDRVGILVSDAGPGIPDPAAMCERGRSGGGSTGLGLDIVRRLAESTGGEMQIGRSVMGGAHVGVWLRTSTVASARPRHAGRGRDGRRAARRRTDTEERTHHGSNTDR